MTDNEVLDLLRSGVDNWNGKRPGQSTWRVSDSRKLSFAVLTFRARIWAVQTFVTRIFETLIWRIAIFAGRILATLIFPAQTCLARAWERPTCEVPRF